jgi:DNA-binding NtrC family response regulator
MDNKPKTIWVVDDDEDIRMSLKDALGFKGFIVREFPIVDSAIAELAKTKPDLIITDYNTYSEKNGLELVAVAKGMEIPIIMQSGSRNVEPIAMQNGAAAFFQKPYNVRELVDAAVKISSGQTYEPVSAIRR